MANEAEIENIALYDRLPPEIPDGVVRQVLQNLQAASRDNHLPAFGRCLEREESGGGSVVGRTGWARYARGRGSGYRPQSAWLVTAVLCRRCYSSARMAMSSCTWVISPVWT